VRCDALRKQERLRNSALAAGKQLKRVAPLGTKTTSSGAHRAAPFRAKTTPSRWHRHSWPFRGRLDSAAASDHIEWSPVPLLR
jgi:hypothetical protein